MLDAWLPQSGGPLLLSLLVVLASSDCAPGPHQVRLHAYDDQAVTAASHPRSPLGDQIGTARVEGEDQRSNKIILAAGRSKAEIEALIKEDPFHKHGLADFRVIEFRASQRADDIPTRVE